MIMIPLSFGPECLIVLLIPWPDNLLSQKYGGDHPGRTPARLSGCSQDAMLTRPMDRCSRVKVGPLHMDPKPLDVDPCNRSR